MFTHVPIYGNEREKLLLSLLSSFLLFLQDIPPSCYSFFVFFFFFVLFLFSVTECGARDYTYLYERFWFHSASEFVAALAQKFEVRILPRKQVNAVSAPVANCNTLLPHVKRLLIVCWLRKKKRRKITFFPEGLQNSQQRILLQEL